MTLHHHAIPGQGSTLKLNGLLHSPRCRFTRGGGIVGGGLDFVGGGLVGGFGFGLVGASSSAASFVAEASPL